MRELERAILMQQGKTLNVSIPALPILFVYQHSNLTDPL